MSRSFSWVRRPVHPIGIDFGTRTIRMMQLARQCGQPAVIACALRELPLGNYAPEELDDLRVQAVQEMLAEGGFVGRSVITALSFDELHVRNLRIPPMPEEEIAAAVQFEAADRLSIDPENCELRCLPAGDVRQGTEIREEVIVLAAERAVIDARVALLARMNLVPAAIDALPCAVFRGFERFLRRTEDANESNLFVDLGYSATRVIVSRGPEIIFIKSVPIGGRRFDELVAEQLSLSQLEAIQVRLRLHRQHIATVTGQGAGEPVAENVRRAALDALRPALEQLGKEIGLCLRYCSVTFRGQRADAATVVGGEASDLDILRVLSDQVNLPFHTGRPMRNLGFELDNDGADRRTGQPEWATALGLALKPVDQMAEVA